jgi:predicted RNA-binding protein (virulence factor B family)
MAFLGRTNRIRLKRFVDFGAYLESENLGEILLPQKYVPEGSEEGDWVEAFIYRDSEDRLIATTTVPYAEVGECAYLEVVQVNRVGAFLDWGLPKDLFVPFAEQHQRMKRGEKRVVYLYVDNTDRIAASERLDRFLPSTTDEYEAGDEVELLISRHTELGYEAVIDDTCLGMVFENDALSQLEAGTRISGYIKNVRSDGKIDLSLQPPLETRDELSERILADLRASGGKSTLTDKSSPDEIFEKYGVSKRAYKRAIGGLYKARLIRIEKGSIELTEKA